MRFKDGIQIVLCLLIFASCSKKEDVLILKKGTAIITGRVNNLSDNSKTIRFAAGSTVENIEQTALIDSKGNFRLELELYHSQNVQGYFKNKFINLFLRPSDSIHIVIDEKVFGQDQFPKFEIEGTNTDVEISKTIQKYLFFCGEYSFNPDAEGKSVKEFHDILQKEIIRKDSVLENFCKSTKVSDSFKVWAQNDIKYGVANYLLNYKFAHKNINGDLFDESLFPINDDNAIASSFYPIHLRHFALNIGIWQDTVTLNLLQKDEKIKAYQRCLNTIISNVEKGLSRDIMCYKSLLTLFNGSFEDYEVVSKKIDTYIENETLKSVLFEKENEYKKQKALDISYLDPESNEEKKISGDFWKELKDKYKWKVVFVDIWATWCVPCRREIPHAIELHEYFKGKEIAFVNLCLDSNKSEWKKVIKNSNIKGDNYFFNEPQTQIFKAKFKFQGYPTYLIVDKQGNLVNKNAPRPSSKDIIEKLLIEWIEKDTL